MAKKNFVQNVYPVLLQNSVLTRLRYLTSTVGVNGIINDIVAKTVGIRFIIQSL